MDTWLWVVIAIAVVALICIVALAAIRARRTKTLKERFGGEYDRVAADAPTKREAESELQERANRREQLDIQPLDEDRREWYRVQWTKVQAAFVDDPGEAVADADGLIQRVMRERGYPVDDFETRAADLSVDHSEVVENYRAAHGITVAHERGSASTDDLRVAVKHYRALFDELVDVRDPEEARA
jgi:hypothetical protein